MTGIFGALKRNPQIPPERCFFPLRVSLLSLLRQRLPGLFSPPRRSRNRWHRLAVWDEVARPPFDLRVYERVCARSILSPCLRVLPQT